MPTVGAPLEVATKNRVRLQQRVEGSRQSVGVDGPLHIRAETHETFCLGEDLLAPRQLPDHRRCKHFWAPWLFANTRVSRTTGFIHACWLFDIRSPLVSRMRRRCLPTRAALRPSVSTPDHRVTVRASPLWHSSSADVG